MTQTYEPFGDNPEPTEWETKHIEGSSMFHIRYGDWIRPIWRITYSWHNGEDKPPFITQDFKNIVFSPGSTQENLFDETPPEVQAVVAKPLFEGSAYQIEATQYERNPEARRLCIEHHGSSCSVCGFDFAKIYGAVADGFIHVHHRTPISEIGETYQIDPIVDLIPLCPNCHALAHIRIPSYDVEEIRALIRTAQKRS
jgi:predicted HNH restriction endonuclease